MDKSSPVFENFQNKMDAMNKRPKVDPAKFMGSGTKKKTKSDEVSGTDEKTVNEISRTLVNINNTLKGIVKILDSQLKLDKKEKSEDDTDAARQLDAKKKKGAENFLELDTKESKEKTKKTSAIVEGAKGIMQRLFTALTAIFAGWLIDKGQKMMQFLQEGDIESFKKLGKGVIKAFAVAAGVFALLNIGPIIGAITSITAGLSAGIPAIIALLANPWTWAVLGLIAGIAGTVMLTKTIIKAVQTKGAGGEEYLEKFNMLKGDLESRGIMIIGTGKKEQFYIAGTKPRKSVAELGTPAQKEAVANYVKKRDQLMGLRDAMREEMKQAKKDNWATVKGTDYEEGTRKRIREQIKEDKAEIRAKYYDKIQALFEGDLELTEGPAENPNKDWTPKNAEEYWLKHGVYPGQEEMGDKEKVNADKLMNKSNTTEKKGEDITPSSEGGINMTESKAKSRGNNDEKISKVSQDTDKNNIQILPFDNKNNAAQEGGTLSSGDATKIPALATSNSGNEYRMFFAHTYQQGNEA